MAETNSSETAAVSAPPRLSLSLSSYRFDFKGRRNADNDLYGFDDLGYLSQVLVGTYQLDPMWTFMFATSYNKNSAVTTFPLYNLTSSDSTLGFGDTRIEVLHPVLFAGGHVVLLEGGLSLPTGSINYKNVTANNGSNYAYNMQMGSGTVDPVVALTYQNYAGNWTHTLRGEMTARVYNNANEYRLGHQYLATASTEYRLSEYFTPMLKANYKNKQGISGNDPTLPRQALLEYYYHPQQNWDLTLAAKSSIPLFKAFNTRLNLEAGLPVYQGLDNFDHVEVITKFYASAGISAAM